jgi:aspartyl-tRNA(Asn)/glutamyl-tRNA(Gln) amidotransferase subunit B
MKIGLEVHVALPTKTKLFCSCSTNADEVNSAICPICVGLPGAKPMLNKEALRMSKAISLGLYSRISNPTSFVRKVYFYPDLPKSFQITQMEGSIGVGGHVSIGKKEIRIRRVQIEEDPAKIIREDAYTLLDFNRSGRPLVEIVTEPDISDEEELRDFLVELQSILYYSGVNIDDEIKVDLNISLQEERVEVKNVTGINNLLSAAKYEMRRQRSVIDAGGHVTMETRSYNEALMKTVVSREKETDEEYGFIYESDLTDFNADAVDAAKPVIASEIISRIAESSGMDARTLRELALFDRQSLRLLVLGAGRDPKVCIGVVEAIKKAGRIDMPDDAFYRLMDAAASGLQLNSGNIGRLERNEKINDTGAQPDDSMLDREIMRMITERKELLAEYKKNERVFNFIAGALIKKYNVSPKHVAERISLVLKTMQF